MSNDRFAWSDEGAKQEAPPATNNIPDRFTWSDTKEGTPAQSQTAAQEEPSFLDKADANINKALAPNPKNYSSLMRTNAIEVPKTLGREVYSTAKSALGVIPGIYHAFADEATPEEKAQNASFEQAHGEEPGAETSGFKRIGLGVQRMSGIPAAIDAYKTYANPATRPTLDQALSVAPEAIGQGAGTVLGAEAAGKAGMKVAEKAPAIYDKYQLYKFHADKVGEAKKVYDAAQKEADFYKNSPEGPPEAVTNKLAKAHADYAEAAKHANNARNGRPAPAQANITVQPQVDNAVPTQVEPAVQDTQMRPAAPETPGSLGSLKARGGKVVDTDPQGLNEALKMSLAPDKTAKPFAMKPLGTPPAEPQAVPPIESRAAPRTGGFIDKADDAVGKEFRKNGVAMRPLGSAVPGDVKEFGFDFRPAEDIGNKIRGEQPVKPKAEPKSEPKAEETKPATVEQTKEEPKKEEPSEGQESAEQPAPKEKEVAVNPENRTRTEEVVSQHTDQDLIKLGDKLGLKHDQYDFSRRDSHRHRVDRDQYVKDVIAKMPQSKIDDIAAKAAKYDKSEQENNEFPFEEASRSSLSKAERARAIMKAHEAGETVGTKEGATADTNHYENAKKELGEGASTSDILKRAQEMKDQANKKE
jgi:hypothetical protein